MTSLKRKAIDLLDVDSDDEQNHKKPSATVANKNSSSKTSLKREIQVIDLLDSDSDDEQHDKKPSAVDPVGYSFARPIKEGDCVICYCDYTVSDGVCLRGCGHTFCQECFTTYVRTKTKDGEVLPNQMKCPTGKECDSPLVQADVLACLDTPQEQDRYLRLTLSRCIDSQDTMGCCPTAGCSFQFEWDEENRKLDCPLCQKSYCLVCQIGPWHSGIRCEQYQKENPKNSSGGDDEDDEAFKSFASKQKLKQCPKCKFWVEKSFGCNAMHCRCNLVFCYVCGGCLKGTAQKFGYKVCHCNSVMQSTLQAHENSSLNHNLMLDANNNFLPGVAANFGIPPNNNNHFGGLPLGFGGMPPNLLGAIHGMGFPNAAHQMGFPPQHQRAPFGFGGGGGLVNFFPGHGQRLGGGGGVRHQQQQSNKRARTKKR